MKKLLLSLLIVSATFSLSAQDNLYLIGSATSAEWALGDAESMQKAQDGWFVWYGELKIGEYKFLETNADWLPSYNPTGVDSKIFKRTDYSEPDDKIYVIDGQAGFYFVEAVTHADVLEASRTKLDAIYPIGEGTLYNWDLGQAVSLTVDDENPAIFSGNITLDTNGDANLKFLTANDDWSSATVFPASMSNTDIVKDAEMDFIMQSNKHGVADRQFIVQEAGSYTITINFETKKIKFVKGDSTSIEDEMIDLSEAKVSYFDLVGNKVKEPTKGIFIKKSELNGKTFSEKVIFN